MIGRVDRLEFGLSDDWLVVFVCRKQNVDDDARQLMLMKEMLLPDGDLYSDTRRQRRFRWRNVGELL